MNLMTSWYLNKYVYISYSCLFHVLDTAIVSSSQIYLTVIWFMRRISDTYHKC